MGKGMGTLVGGPCHHDCNPRISGAMVMEQQFGYEA
jgi:hypothetical protein